MKWTSLQTDALTELVKWQDRNEFSVLCGNN